MHRSALAVALGMLAVSAAQAKPVNLECTLDSADGQPIPWRITLDEAAGTADVSINNRRPDRSAATFYPDKVRFYVGSMRMELSRIDLTIFRYSRGEDQPPNSSKCKLSDQPKVVF